MGSNQNSGSDEKQNNTETVNFNFRYNNDNHDIRRKPTYYGLQEEVTASSDNNRPNTLWEN